MFLMRLELGEAADHDAAATCGTTTAVRILLGREMVNGGDNDSDCEEEDDTMLNHGRRIAVLVEVLLQWKPLLETPRQDSLFWRVNRTTQRKCRRHDA